WNIKYAYLRADNAGCYHAAETLLSNKKFFEETGIFIRCFDYSDPQSGKSACDRMSAVVKCNIRRHINEKNNVENSKEFVDAARTTQYLSIFANANDDRQSDSEFEEDEKTEEGNNHNKNDVAKNNSKPFVFDCPDPHCIRQFRPHANLQVHLSTGIHKYQPNRLKLLDKAKLHYKQQLENDENEHIRSTQNFKTIHSSNGNVNYELKQRWALFNRKPLTYLVQKYNEGEKNGMKWDPPQVAEQMQPTINNGHYVFEPSQWLTSSQIKSFFC
ncbi:unnamed protein product, partial [Rotaria sp. Silwood1]